MQTFLFFFKGPAGPKGRPGPEGYRGRRVSTILNCFYVCYCVKVTKNSPSSYCASETFHGSDYNDNCSTAWASHRIQSPFCIFVVVIFFYYPVQGAPPNLICPLKAYYCHEIVYGLHKKIFRRDQWVILDH